MNKVNLPEVEIDDSEFRVNGEVYENYGKHMELEFLKEYDGTITIDQLKKHGLKGNIQGPRRAAEEISEFISSVE